MYNSYVWVVFWSAMFTTTRSIGLTLSIHLRLQYIDPKLYPQAVGWSSITNCIGYLAGGPILGKNFKNKTCLGLMFNSK